MTRSIPVRSTSQPAVIVRRYKGSDTVRRNATQARDLQRLIRDSLPYHPLRSSSNTAYSATAMPTATTAAARPPARPCPGPFITAAALPVAALAAALVAVPKPDVTCEAPFVAALATSLVTVPKPEVTFDAPSVATLTTSEVTVPNPDVTTDAPAVATEATAEVASEKMEEMTFGLGFARDSGRIGRSRRRGVDGRMVVNVVYCWRD